MCRKKVVVKLAWCMEKTWWTTQYQWSKVILSDESQVCIGQDKRVYVWRKRGEGENGPQIQCHGVGMYLIQRRRNTYQGGREYKC